MTFTATAEPFNVPPRVRIDVGTGDSSKPFTSLTILRDGKPIREQPYVGGSAAVAFDYEAPFGSSSTYTAVGEVATLSPLYSTAWANLTGWTTTFGSAAVSGGFLISPTSAAIVTHPLTALARGRLVLGAGIVGPGSVRISTAGGRDLELAKVGANAWTAFYGNVGRNIDVGTGAVVMTFDEAGASVETTTGSWYLPRAASSGSGTTGIEAVATTTASRIPSISVEQYATSPFSASATSFLDVQETWLVHPSQPSLSVAIDVGPQGGGRVLRFIEASSGDSKSSAAQSTIHRPVGRRKAVVITSGPRAADEWTLVLGAPTIVGKNAIRSIVDDQSPLLLRSPADSVSDLPDDWYSVGDVTVARVEAPVITQETLITLPLTPVDEPIVRQGALWTYGSGLLANATYADSRAEFPTYLDRLAGVS